jgi:hypothetical protein
VAQDDEAKTIEISDALQDVLVIFCLTAMAAHIVVARTADLKGGDVAGECDAGSSGSDGASPYPELRPTTTASASQSFAL